MNNEIKMDRALMARAFNEWMRRYVEEPKRFETEFGETLAQFQKEDASADGPTYGARCTAYLEQIAGELSANG